MNIDIFGIVAHYLNFETIYNCKLLSKYYANMIPHIPDIMFFNQIKRQKITQINTFNDYKNCVVPYIKYRYILHPIINIEHLCIK